MHTCPPEYGDIERAEWEALHSSHAWLYPHYLRLI